MMSSMYGTRKPQDFGENSFFSRPPCERLCKSFIFSEHTFDPGLKPLEMSISFSGLAVTCQLCFPIRLVVEMSTRLFQKFETLQINKRTLLARMDKLILNCVNIERTITDIGLLLKERFK